MTGRRFRMVGSSGEGKDTRIAGVAAQVGAAADVRCVCRIIARPL